MTVRQYDKERDKLYMPDATPHLFLSQEQVSEALDCIPAYEERSEKDMRRLIVEIESLNRAEKLGKISPQECLVRNREVADEFRGKYEKWPYQTKTYKRFYELFGCRVD